MRFARALFLAVNKILVLESESLGHRFQVWASEAEVALEVFYAKKPTCLMERTIETRRDYRDFVVLGAFSVNGQVLPPYMIPLNRLVFYQLASFHSKFERFSCAAIVTKPSLQLCTYGVGRRLLFATKLSFQVCSVQRVKLSNY